MPLTEEEISLSRREAVERWYMADPPNFDKMREWSDSQPRGTNDWLAMRKRYWQALATSDELFHRILTSNFECEIDGCDSKITNQTYWDKDHSAALTCADHASINPLG